MIDLTDHGIAGVERSMPVGYFVRTALKYYETHPNGTNAYEEVLDFNQPPALSDFLQRVPEMALGSRGSNRGSVSSIGSIGSYGSQ